MKIRIGIGLGTGAAGELSTDGFWDVVDACESGGWDSIWFSEKVTGGIADPLAAMAAVAGRTRRLKFGPSVLVLPGRNPVLLAKELATIDVLSGGRLVVAFGLGSDFPSEHELLGVARGERASMTDEGTALIRRLWTQENVTHEGRHYTVRNLTLRPRPVQQPAPDIWFGGHSPAALRRTGRLGDGWLPSFVTPDEYGHKAEGVRAEAAAAGREIEEEHFGCLVVYAPEGRDAEPLLGLVRARRPDVDPTDVVVVGGAGALRERVEAFITRGASKFVVVPALPPPDWLRELDLLRAKVADPLEN
jgi:probable F420-dependent oxidoreductase